MALALYDLPNGRPGLLIIGAWVILSLAGYALFRRLHRASSTATTDGRDHREQRDRRVVERSDEESATEARP
jgi:hypothetical protein